MNINIKDSALIRPLEERDLEERVKWINDRDISRTLMFDYPTSLAKTKAWFTSNLMNPTKQHFTVARKTDDKAIGMTGLLDISFKHRKAQAYITIGNPNFWNKGIGSKALRYTAKYGFNELRLNRIYLYTLRSNTKARALYQKIGFKLEGIHKNSYFCNGDWHDLFVQAIFADGFAEKA